MTKITDYGIVLLPNYQCKLFDAKIKQVISEKLPTHQQAINNTHVTLYHIANVDEAKFDHLKDTFIEFANAYSIYPIKFEIKAITATGGNSIEGYKWLDIQFTNVQSLVDLRENTLTTFKNFHSGTLTRMNDDMPNFTEEQSEQIAEYGVTVYPYTPHVTSCYINLPTESKTIILQNVAELFNDELIDQVFDATAIALVELGRNGNAHTILHEVHMACLNGVITDNVTELS